MDNLISKFLWEEMNQKYYQGRYGLLHRKNLVFKILPGLLGNIGFRVIELWVSVQIGLNWNYQLELKCCTNGSLKTFVELSPYTCCQSQFQLTSPVLVEHRKQNFGIEALFNPTSISRDVAAVTNYNFDIWVISKSFQIRFWWCKKQHFSTQFIQLSPRNTVASYNIANLAKYQPFKVGFGLQKKLVYLLPSSVPVGSSDLVTSYLVSRPKILWLAKVLLFWYLNPSKSDLSNLI